VKGKDCVARDPLLPQVGQFGELAHMDATNGRAFSPWLRAMASITLSMVTLSAWFKIIVKVVPLIRFDKVSPWPI